MAVTESKRQETVRLEDYLRILKDRAWVIILVTVVTVLVALYVSLTTTPLYSASARLVYQRNNLDTAVSGYGLNTYDYDKDRTIATLVAAIRNSETMAEAVKTQLGSSKPAAIFMGMVSVHTTEGSDLVDIGAASTDAEEAATVANAYADQFIIYRQNADRATVAAAREVVEEQLATLGVGESQNEYRLMLQEKRETLRVMEAMQNGGFTLMRQAVAPSSPYTPQTRRNIVLSLVVGLVLGIGLAFLIEYLDKRVKDEKTLERVSGLPVLTSVPLVGGAWKRAKRGRRSGEAVGFGEGGPALLESFRTLRSTLQYFDVDGTLHTILVTSGLPQEGKTVTTVNLGISLALSGKRVIVLEADLRRPMVHEYLGLENEVGLSSVLAGKSSVPSALQLVEMDPFIPERSRTDQSKSATAALRKNLYCVTSGPLPPNPAELLQSAKMGHVVSELKHMGDYLLIDTPPVLPVSDTLTLAPYADAVILTAKLRSSTRDEIQEVCELLGRAGVHAIGLVAEGRKNKRSYYYKRGYHYGGYSYQ
jgi:succinoglycan biosynthesis transport protein ExoP